LARTRADGPGEVTRRRRQRPRRRGAVLPHGARIIVCRFEDYSEVARAFPTRTQSMPGIGLDRNGLAAERKSGQETPIGCPAAVPAANLQG